MMAAITEERAPIKQLSSMHGGVLLAVVLLAAVGLATVHSASSEMVHDYLPRQALWVGFGLLVMIAAMSVEYHVLLDSSVILYVVGLGMLIAVLAHGTVRGGAANWFQIAGFQFQPSEFAKLATALYLARYLSALNTPLLNLRQIAIGVGIVLVPMVLVGIEPDMGGALMFAPIAGGMILVSGVRIRLLLIAVLIGAVFAVALWSYGMKPYQRQRVLTFISPTTDPLGSGYQVRQSKIAVGSGELAGKGYMQGTQSQLRFLPARHTDFILAVLAEEWGFLGVAVVLGLFAFYVTSAAQIAMRARDRAGLLVVVGLLSMQCFHILYNAAMVIGAVPITGIPIPFISYGGTFMMVNFCAVGIILGVDLRRYVNR
jgi:rod shape determining protein RodA